MKRFLTALGIVAVSSTLSAQEDPGANRNFLKMLAGKAGVAEFITENFEDGRTALTTIGEDENGEPVFHAIGGKLLVDSEKLYLRCNDLTYGAGDGLLVAIGDPDRVEIRAEGMEADCSRLEYFLDTGDVVMRDTGAVSQETPENSVRFEGMQTFRAAQTETGAREVKLQGSDTITVSISAKEGGEGFAGLGDSVMIETKPYRTEAPDVSAELTTSNQLSRFRAKGDVKIIGTDLSLLAEEVIYNALDGTLEANGRIFLKRENIEAECGRLVYDQNTGEITLSVLPLVRDRDPEGITIYSDFDTIRFVMEEGGIPDTGLEGRGSIRYEKLPEPKQNEGQSETNGLQPEREIVIPE